MFSANLKAVFDPHRHVPLFFADNTPMLFVTWSNKHVILVEISPEAADKPNVCFSDMNVAATGHSIYSDPADLANLHWPIIRSRHGAFGADWKRKRAAEMLIPNNCPPSFFKTIHVQPAVIDGTRAVDVARTLVANSEFRHSAVREDLSPEGVRKACRH
jgi:hypothetical protein